MLSKERLITYCIIFILLGTLIYFIFLGNEEYVVNYDVKIEALESKVDSLHNINDNLVYKIDTLNQQIVKLDQQIGFQDNKIVKLKYKVNEKVNTVDLFSDDELTRFFTVRYEKGNSTQETDSTSSN